MQTTLRSIRLILRIGPTIAQPASYDVSIALTRVEVTDDAEEIDGFQLTFTLGKNKDKAKDYNLLQSNLFDPGSRVQIGVLLNGSPEVLIDGIITHHQLTPSNEPGMFTFTVMGKDTSLKLDLVERNQKYEHQTDSQIVESILDNSDYAYLGFDTQVTSTDDVSDQNHVITRQASTDLKFIQMLAKRNGFVFYVNPDTFSNSNVYWGPENRLGTAQPALTMYMGSATNVTSLSFSNDALVPTNVQGSYIDPDNKQINPLQDSPSFQYPLAATPTQIMRTILLRSNANQTSSQASIAAQAALIDSKKSVTGQGELDTVRYGHILRAGELVGVRGVGASYNGDYYVRQVRHTIERGNYTQSFTLSREGIGARSTREPV